MIFKDIAVPTAYPERNIMAGSQLNTFDSIVKKYIVPESITYYNKTMHGVGAVDQMARKYSVKTGNFGWPIQFFNMLDLAKIAR